MPASTSIPPPALLATILTAVAAAWEESKFICSATFVSRPPAALKILTASAAASSPFTTTRPEALDRVKSIPAPVTPKPEAEVDVILKAPVAPVKVTAPVAVKSVNTPGKPPEAIKLDNFNGVTILVSSVPVSVSV